MNTVWYGTPGLSGLKIIFLIRWKPTDFHWKCQQVGYQAWFSVDAISSVEAISRYGSRGRFHKAIPAMWAITQNKTWLFGSLWLRDRGAVYWRRLWKNGTQDSQMAANITWRHIYLQFRQVFKISTPLRICARCNKVTKTLLLPPSCSLLELGLTHSEGISRPISLKWWHHGFTPSWPMKSCNTTSFKAFS